MVNLRQLVYVFIGICVLTNVTFAKIEVSSYDINAAVKATISSSALSNVNVLSTSTGGNLVVLGYWYVNSGMTNSDDIIVTSTRFNMFEFDSVGGLDMDPLALNVEFGFIGTEPLFYPSPFSFSRGNGVLYYKLTKPPDTALEIHMYDIFGHRIFKRICNQGSLCGQGGINRIKIDKNTPELNGYELSAGVYFYLFIYEGKVIYKNKVGIVP